MTIGSVVNLINIVCVNLLAVYIFLKGLWFVGWSPLDKAFGKYSALTIDEKRLSRNIDLLMGCGWGAAVLSLLAHPVFAFMEGALLGLALLAVGGGAGYIVGRVIIARGEKE